MAAVKISLLVLLFGAYIALALAQQKQQAPATCTAEEKKCDGTSECCSKCCLGTKCVHPNQCAPKCTGEITVKCKAGDECFLKPVANCSKPPCKPEQACRYKSPCDRLNCESKPGFRCVDIGGNPRTAACQPIPTAKPAATVAPKKN